MASPNQKNNNDTIDIVDLVKKIGAKWHIFLISLLICGGLAFAYLKFAEQKYPIAASIYVKGVDVGSKEAGELIGPGAERGGGSAIALTNEITKITSYSAVKAALEGLNFGISYYNVEGFWPDFMREGWLNEIGGGAFPYTVSIDSSKNQLMNTPIFISPVSDNQVRIYASKSEGYAPNLKGEGGAKVVDYELDEVVPLDKPYTSDFVSITVSRKENAKIDPDFDYSYKLITDHDLAMQYQGKLVVEPADVKDIENRMLLLKINEALPQKGVAFLDALINTYESQNLTKKNTTGENSVEFLNKKIAQLRDSIDVAEAELETYKRENNILNYELESNSTSENLGNLEQRQSEIQQRLTYYKNTLSSLRNSNGATSIIAPSAAGINQDPLFNELVQQYVEVATRLNKLRASATDSNPLVTQLRTEAESLREALVDNLSSSIRAEQTNLSSTNGQIARIRGTLNKLPGKERKLQVMDRELTNLRTKYNELVNTRETAQMSLATNSDNIDVVDAPKKVGYRPVEPNATLTYAIAIALGLMIPLAFVLIKDVNNNNIRNKDELENQSRAPLLGMIANGPKDAKLITHKYPNSAIAESFKFARINLQYFHQSGQDKVIGVTSSISGEGKTFCSANLSAAFAESGKRTITICCDLRKPRIQDYFNLRGPGISEYLSDMVAIDDIIQPTDIRNLDVIAPGMPQEDPIKMFESSRMDALIAELKKRYDNIVVETPPIGYVADYFVLLKHFDVNLFVVRYNYTNKNILGGINDLYVNNKIQNLYLLFNDVKFSSDSGYGYLSNSDGYYSNTYVRKLNSKKGSLKNPFTS